MERPGGKLVLICCNPPLNYLRVARGGDCWCDAALAHPRLEASPGHQAENLGAGHPQELESGGHAAQVPSSAPSLFRVICTTATLPCPFLSAQ